MTSKTEKSQEDCIKARAVWAAMEEGAEMGETPPVFSFHLNITSSRTASTIITRFKRDLSR